jgi:hypothetical protein
VESSCCPFPSFAAGTWKLTSGSQDTIDMEANDFSGTYSFFSTGGENRHPRISNGIPAPDLLFHIWSIWESNVSGHWKLYGSTIGLALDVKGDKTVPTKFVLNHNYPNPFNPVTTIQYELPSLSKVTLKIFNLLGQEIRTLVDETQEPGVKNVKVNADNLSSGVYFYRLEAQSVSNVGKSFREVKKMVVLK